MHAPRRFPYPDGRWIGVLYTNVLQSTASDSIISPQAICAGSKGYLARWSQEGTTTPPTGKVTFYDKNDKVVISLELQHHNGLFYTTTAADSIDHGQFNNSAAKPKTIYFHTEDGIEDEEASLDDDMAFPEEFGAQAYLFTKDQQNHPRRQQLEADLWQARMGHCGEWQLRVLPHAVHGTPSEFNPHPFSSYDHYDRARIRKIPATKGKHPSRATEKQQRFFMDFGFLRASNFDYSRPDKSKDRIIQSFDGYNSYLLIVDEHTRFIWIFLCKTKEPPLDLVNLHLDIFGSRLGGSIRCDQGGELARSHEFVTQMTLLKYTVEPTGADDPAQNKAAEKWNDVLAVTVRVLLYGSGLPAPFWSVALLHAVWLHNRRIHRSTMMTPYEAWHGIKPDLTKLRIFGSRVCVKRTGKRRSKLDRHDFTGIFLGYTATDENIRYVDVNSRIVKTSHHAIFDEAWYLQPKRPPFAQMLYDVGLEFVPEEISAPALAPPMPVPLGTNEKFHRDLYNAKGDPDPKAQALLAKKMGFGYRKAIGELIWPMTTCRPDLSQGVVKCSQASAAPAEIHYNAVKSIFRYCAATISDGIYYWRMAPRMDLPEDDLPTIHSTPQDLMMKNRPVEDALGLCGYMDSSWANCPLTRRSTGGTCLRLAGGPIGWKGRLLPTVALSSTESEFMEASDAGRMCLYCRSILWDLGIPQEAATVLYEDNDGATAMANAGKPTSRSRHIDIKYYALQEWVERDLMILQRIDTSLNMADHYTKPLPRTLFYRHNDYNMGRVPPTYSPKYLDCLRVYTADNKKTTTKQKEYTARAAKTTTNWEIIVLSLHGSTFL